MDLTPITMDELRDKIDGGVSFVLVDALPPMSYAHSHLPGAVNLPPRSVDDAVTRRLDDKSVEIVVYCANPACEDSHETARRLSELGYSNLRHYAGGKDEWRDAGLPLERAGRTLS